MTPVQETATDGVPGEIAAGTPSPLAGTPDPAPWDADALETLELAAALARVAAHAAGPLGAARVRGRLPTTDVAWIRGELARVGEIIALLRRGDTLLAEPVPDATRTLARLRVEGGVLDGTELVAVRHLLVAARRVRLDLLRVAELAPRSAALLTDLPDRAIDQRLERSVDDDGNLLDTASPQLAAARQAVQAARQRLLRRLDTILRGLDAQVAMPEASVTVRNGRYVIPVRRDSRARPQGIVHDESGSAGTLFLEPTEAVEQGNALREAQGEEERETLRVLRELTGMLRPARETLLGALEMCVAVDDLVARAKYAVAHDAEVPEVELAPAPLAIVRGRHPLLLARGEPVVPFDLTLDGRERTLLVSGPNTGGKTVLLKATALACALAQGGIVPPVGPGTQLPAFARCFADIGDRQSIAASLSTFSAHVAMLRRILDEADDTTLVLLDEVGSGTDPAEGAALAAATLVALTRRGAVTLATTHLGALKVLATDTGHPEAQPKDRLAGAPILRSAQDDELAGAIVNGSLQFDGESLRPTYRFLKGVPGRSYGLAIARRLGIQPTIVDDAEARVPAAERNLDALLAAVEAQAAALRTRQAALDEQAIVAESLDARLTLQAESQAAREKELTRREREADREARTQAKRYLLDARKQVEAALEAAHAAADDVKAKEARRLLEDGIRTANEALGARVVSDDEPPAPDGTAITPGTRVRTAGGVVGDVLELRGDGRLMLSVNGMRMVVEGKGAQAVSRRQEKKAGTRAEEAPARPSAGAPDASFEIDLRGQTGDEAAQTTLAALDAAVLAEQPYLRIIHGMGTGVVRERVRRVVAADRRVASFDFAPRAQGGTGVTIVEFKA